ncbi:MAG: 50S ribosomal protein L2 [Patescibacteria group bacterium]
MAMKHCRPTTPARRQMTIADFSGLTKKRPEKSLSGGKQRISGRGSGGKVRVRHRGGGHKKLFRLIDFKRRDKAGVPGTVAALEYDPNRSARIALVHYNDGEKRYILAPDGLQVGETVVCAPRTKVKTGNCMQLKNIPVGYKIHNVELTLGRGGQIVRSAGTAATLVGIDGRHAIVELPSGEIRRLSAECSATIGTVSNLEHNLITIGKAGRMRWMGKKPQVLGKSMNAVDHPHGGGEGHSPIGLKHPKTPWGKNAIGVKTRRKKKSKAHLLRPRVKRLRKK